MIENVFSVAHQEFSLLKFLVQENFLYAVKATLEMRFVGGADRAPMVGMDEDLHKDRCFLIRQVAGYNMLLELGGREIYGFFPREFKLEIILGIGEIEIKRSEVGLIVEAEIPHVQTGDGNNLPVDQNCFSWFFFLRAENIVIEEAVFSAQGRAVRGRAGDAIVASRTHGGWRGRPEWNLGGSASCGRGLLPGGRADRQVGEWRQAKFFSPDGERTACVLKSRGTKKACLW